MIRYIITTVSLASIGYGAYRVDSPALYVAVGILGLLGAALAANWEPPK